MDKADIRQILLAQRRAQPAEEVTAKSAKITGRALDNIDWPSVQSLHIYSSVDEWREVDTKDLVRKISARWPHIKIVQPQLSRDNPIPKEGFDVIVVPTLGFDNERNRLGLGGGWYDKFLATQPEALKVGLAYELGHLEQILPTEPHDIRLDKVITEHQVY